MRVPCPYVSEGEVSKKFFAKIIIFQSLFFYVCVKSFHSVNFSTKSMAEPERFELSVGCPTHAFQACALDHYATVPCLSIYLI